MNNAFLSRIDNLRLQAKERKRKRRNKYRKIQNIVTTKRFRYQQRLRNLFSSELSILDRTGFLNPKYCKETILVPKVFSFKDNFNDTIIFFKTFLSSFYYGKNLSVDFTNCQYSDISAFAVLNLLNAGLENLLLKYNLGLYNRTNKKIIYKPSRSDGKTNKYLHAFHYHILEDKFKDNSSYLPLDLLKGKRKSTYRENPKAIACSRIVRFVFESLLGAGQNQGARDIAIQNPLEGLVTEVLNNAEDHSPNGTEWFVSGISFREVQHDTKVVELNLSILNFGVSMYEGFEKTKDQNQEQYSTLEKLYLIHKEDFSFFHQFSRESLFTLYMLNEGISRLKFEDESRGHGTMNFIDSFIKLGKLGDTNPKFMSTLNIVSGHTRLTCDNKYKPYVDGDFRKISLNQNHDIKKLPDKKYLVYETEYFPGTILDCKIYFENII